MTKSPLAAARQRIATAYSPQLLRQLGQQLADQVADHMQRVQDSSGSVLNWNDAEDNVRQALEPIDNPNTSYDDETLKQVFIARLETILQRGQNLHDPRYIGHQVPAPIPIAGLFDAVGAITNQVMAIYEMGPWATSVERAMVQRLGMKVGWEAGEFAGLVTHGGSLANLTGLLTARNVALEHSWERGVQTSSAALVVHSDAHYSVSRSAGVLGIGTDNLYRAELDSLRRIDPDKLDVQLSQLKGEGRQVFAVVACACATPIGAFDPLDQIADVCQKHEVWLHVDAAHGGAVCFSETHQHLLNGWDQADSLVWDAHKMMFVPALCAFVLYKNKDHRFETFRQNAPYLFDPSAPGMAEYDSGLLTIECTKRAAAFSLWGVWSMFGPQLFADLVDVTFDTARLFYEKISDHELFEAIHQPQCNIVAFRHIPASLQNASAEVIGQLQHKIRRKLIRSGEFYIVQATIDGVPALRLTVCNPLTAERHLDQLLETLIRLGRDFVD